MRSKGSLYTKILFVFFLTILLVSTETTICAAREDGTSYRNDSSSLFSPGYINAAKYQAEAVINQNTQKKNLIENIIEGVLGKTENKVDRSRAEIAKVTPKLQKKTSVRSSNHRAGTNNKIAIDDKARQEIVSNLARAMAMHVVGLGYGFETLPNTDQHFDLNGDEWFNGDDAALLLQMWANAANMNDAEFTSAFSKVMAEAKDRIGTKEGDAYYASVFDINNDGKVDLTDYDGIRQAIGEGRSSLPDAAFYRANFMSSSESSQSYLSDNNKLTQNSSLSSSLYDSDNSTNLSSMLKNSLKGKIGETLDRSIAPGTRGVKSPINNPLGESALAVPLLNSGQGVTDVEASMRLANILKNPSEYQKITLDTIKALLEDINTVEKESGEEADAGLAKATDDLLQATANLLLAQAIPDLLKSGDVANIKAIFTELNTAKNNLMLEYAKSTKPYFDNIIKDLAKNMSILQLRNILSSSLTKEDLEKLPPSELDKILNKIKKEKNRGFEEEYILQQEAKYRRIYLDPNKERFREDMTGIIKTFTQKINTALTDAESAK